MHSSSVGYLSIQVSQNARSLEKCMLAALRCLSTQVSQNACVQRCDLFAFRKCLYLLHACSVAISFNPSLSRSVVCGGPHAYEHKSNDTIAVRRLEQRRHVTAQSFLLAVIPPFWCWTTFAGPRCAFWSGILCFTPFAKIEHCCGQIDSSVNGTDWQIDSSFNGTDWQIDNSFNLNGMDWQIDRSY